MKISVLGMISLNGQVRVLDLVRMFDKGNTPSSFRGFAAKRFVLSNEDSGPSMECRGLS